MANPFFSIFGSQQVPPIIGMSQVLQQFKRNPIEFLFKRNMNIPSNIANDPNAIINYLLSTGQITQDQVNNAYRILQNGG